MICNLRGKTPCSPIRSWMPLAYAAPPLCGVRRAAPLILLWRFSSLLPQLVAICPAVPHVRQKLGCHSLMQCVAPLAISTALSFRLFSSLLREPPTTWATARSGSRPQTHPLSLCIVPCHSSPTVLSLHFSASRRPLTPADSGPDALRPVPAGTAGDQTTCGFSCSSCTQRPWRLALNEAQTRRCLPGCPSAAPSSRRALFCVADAHCVRTQHGHTACAACYH